MSASTAISFDRDRQKAFAELSGDFNPLHLDENHARRTMFGRPIVHGLNIALGLLERICAGQPTVFRKIGARFNRPLFVDEVADVEISVGDGQIDAVCRVGAVPLTQLRLSEPGAVRSDVAWAPGKGVWSRVPAEHDLTSLAAARGTLILPYAVETVAGQLPNAVGVYGMAPIAHLLALTRIVGMEAPGLHSVFGGFSVELRGGSSAMLDYAVQRVSPKTSHLKLAIESDVLSGTADAFLRPKSQELSYDSVARHVAGNEFAGRRALIIGGSRGLGLISAYLLAAGGAEIVTTYRVGKNEAEHAVETILAAGGNARALPLDVTAPADAFARLAESGFRPTDVYYFATPHIFERKKALFEPALFDGFIRSYVSDFAAIVELTRQASQGEVAIFYPSSDALNQPVKELAEYTVAKAAGEAFCSMIDAFDPGVRIVISRLPRLPTDQTATLMEIAAADPVVTMLDICRRMQGETRSAA